MKILFVGDIVGRAGRKIVRERLAQIKEEHEIEFTIANVENATGGGHSYNWRKDPGLRSRCYDLRQSYLG
jgi:calcineurin-like phosphoesterase